VWAARKAGRLLADEPTAQPQPTEPSTEPLPAQGQSAEPPSPDFLSPDLPPLGRAVLPESQPGTPT